MINYKNGRKWRENQNILIEKTGLRGKLFGIRNKILLVNLIFIVWITKL